ncbi:MAG TPA: U32 family peptidase [Candidatus Magasanikbacteria bacterium]|nr:U32 family peptidase [Candidatus Magasanikbacteria bacterium]
MKKTTTKIELLAPAGNLECGLAAIRAGADAVYIGGPKFGARVAASNSLSDIETLVKKAHVFGVKVYVTMNTILFDSELADAEKMARSLIQVGVDALIVQDMAYAEMGLPIPLHASTQCDNRTPEKVRFLTEAGFPRIVLARELDLSQIKHIKEVSPEAELEFFVHGALCVSESGKCYLSSAITSRSANRGECSQPCRLPYNLIDADGKIVAKEKHLLCLRDLNLSEHIEPLIDAGITSFKIEGRLKTPDYVENVTAYYREKIDAVLEKRPELAHASTSETVCGFEPAPSKSFNRGFTTYSIGNDGKYFNPETPKSLGEKLGKIITLGRNYFILDNKKVTMTPNDGVCFFHDGKLVGTNINHFNDGKIYPNKTEHFAVGMTIYRNHDEGFLKQLKSEPCVRKVLVDAKFVADGKSLTLTYETANGLTGSATIANECAEAKNPDLAKKTITEQIGKLGTTDFQIGEVSIKWKKSVFTPVATINELRRLAIKNLEVAIVSENTPITKIPKPTKNPYPEKELDVDANVSNAQAEKFYKQHGVTTIKKTDEFTAPRDKKLMTTKLCLRREYGLCPKVNADAGRYRLPLYLERDGVKLKLDFDCAKCRMGVSQN